MKFKVIDAHVHLGLHKMPDHCKEFIRRIGFLNSLNLRPEDFKLSNDYLMIDKIILVPSYPCGNNLATDGFYEQYEWRKNHDVFLQYGTINPLADVKVREELNKQYSMGIVGIKLHPVHHGYKPNDYRKEEKNLLNLQEVYQFAEDYKLPVTIHTGTSLTSFSRNKYGNPIYCDDVIKDFNVNIILAHAGRPLWSNEAFFLARSYENVYIEISSIPPKRLKEYLPRLDEIKNKVIYGSDFPNFSGHDLIGNAIDVINLIGYDQGIMMNNILKLINYK
jgi:Predicted metal-dependent hydrolase of the TIM-barrel fold